MRVSFAKPKSVNFKTPEFSEMKCLLSGESGAEPRSDQLDIINLSFLDAISLEDYKLQTQIGDDIARK